jgi:hypothetical protein
MFDTTPSGIEVKYTPPPKRQYEICLGGDEWRAVPSVTQVLNVLSKDALPWWGMKVGAEGVQTLCHKGLIRDYGGSNIGDEYTPNIYDLDVDGIVALLTEHKLTVNHVRDKAGDRGQAVHDALEAWARHGHIPDPSIYPEEQEGYVRGLVAFLKDVPTAEPEGAEVLVASAEYGYAGRYDLRLKTNAEHEVVVRRTATKVRKRTLPAGRYLCDLKTSKNVYGSHVRQLEAYEQASIESGYEPTDGRGVLLVTPDGGYELKRSWATFEDFRVVLDVWNSEQEMAKRKKAA